MGTDTVVTVCVVATGIPGAWRQRRVVPHIYMQDPGLLSGRWLKDKVKSDTLQGAYEAFQLSWMLRRAMAFLTVLEVIAHNCSEDTRVC